MALTEIEYGSLASSEIMNNNFQYLDNRISNVSETVSTNQAGVNSNIASINSTLTSMSEEIDADIEEINKSLEETIAKFSENGIFTTTYVNGTSWYREYFSDEKKETRVWLEQGGLCASRGTATFIKAFRDANYSLTLGTHNCNYEHGGISSKTAGNFTHYDGKGWSYTVEWYACGI